MTSDNTIKSNRGIILPARAREIVFNLNKYFESEKVRANGLLRELNVANTIHKVQGTPEGIVISKELFADLSEFLKYHSKVNERVVQATGVAKNTVTRIKYEGMAAEADGHKIMTPVRKTRGKTIILDNCDLHALSELIIKLYMEGNSVPSVSKILDRARVELNYQGSKTTLRRILVEELEFKVEKDDQIKQLTMTRPIILDGEHHNVKVEMEDLEMENEELNHSDYTTNEGNTNEDSIKLPDELT